MVTPLPPGPERADTERAGPARPQLLHRRVSLFLVVVAVALTAVAVGAWRPGRERGPDPAALPLGDAGSFPSGSVTERVVVVEGIDASELGDTMASGEAAERIRLLIVNDPESGLVALSGLSPFRGCRVVEISAAEAGGFGHTRTRGLERGFLDPCHGGLFALDGTHLGGPGERGLVRFSVRRAPDGSLAVDLTRPRHAPSVRTEG